MFEIGIFLEALAKKRKIAILIYFDNQ